MHAPQSPHDALFRYVFGKPRHAASLLACCVPRALARAIDWRTLARDETTFVDDRLRRRAADLLFTARFRRRRWPLCLLPEHLSTDDPFAVLKMLGYGVRIWERGHRDQPRRRRLPFVLAIVLHHGPRPFAGQERLRTLVLGGLRETAGAPRLRRAMMAIVVHDLAAKREQQLRDPRLTPFASLALLFLQHLRGADDERAAAAFRRWRRALAAVADSATGRQDLEALFSYLHATTDLDLERLRAVFAAIHPNTEHAYMTTADRIRRKAIKEGIAKGIVKGIAKGMTTADRIRQEAIKEGIAQGLAKGLAKGIAKGIAKGVAAGEARGQAAVVLRLLQKKFGPLPSDLVTRVQSADRADLDRFADLVLTAKTLAEFVAAG
jgi:predicted transposase YdaD